MGTEPKLPDFGGKLVMAIFNRPGEDHTVIQNPRFEEQGGRLFLVGTIPAGVIPGFDGLPAAVAWENVEQYIVLQSVEQYLQCGQQYMAAIRKFGSAVPQSLFSRIIRASFR
jgi:hypothetical protein